MHAGRQACTQAGTRTHRHGANGPPTRQLGVCCALSTKTRGRTRPATDIHAVVNASAAVQTGSCKRDNATGTGTATATAAATTTTTHGVSYRQKHKIVPLRHKQKTESLQKLQRRTHIHHRRQMGRSAREQCAMLGRTTDAAHTRTNSRIKYQSKIVHAHAPTYRGARFSPDQRSVQRRCTRGTGTSPSHSSATSTLEWSRPTSRLQGNLKQQQQVSGK